MTHDPIVLRCTAFHGGYDLMETYRVTSPTGLVLTAVLDNVNLGGAEESLLKKIRAAQVRRTRSYPVDLTYAEMALFTSIAERYP